MGFLLLGKSQLDLQSLLGAVAQNDGDFLFTDDHGGAFRPLPVELDGIKGALGGANAAADALVGIHHGRAAAQAPGSLRLDLLLREGQAGIPEGVLVINGGIPAGNLTGGIVVAVHPNVLFVKRHEVPAVSADGQAGMGADKAVDGNGTLTSGGDGIDGKFGAGVYVAAHKNVRLRGLVGQTVGLGPISSAQFHLGAIQQAAPLNALPDG